MSTITATVAAELYNVDLTLTGVPPVTDAFGAPVDITGVRITYTGRKATAVRFDTAADQPLFVASTELDRPDAWPSWVRSLVEEHRPADRAEVLAEAEGRLRDRAGQLTDLAEEEMRRDLEERAQEWHEAADVLSRMAAE